LGDDAIRVVGFKLPAAAAVFGIFVLGSLLSTWAVNLLTSQRPRRR
jgi:hypothetical protein